MIFKTVKFNIFEENLQDIVYGKERASQAEKNNQAERRTERLVQKVDEIVVRPLNEKRFDSDRERK
jgi:hypothetical protein